MTCIVVSFGLASDINALTDWNYHAHLWNYSCLVACGTYLLIEISCVHSIRILFFSLLHMDECATNTHNCSYVNSCVAVCSSGFLLFLYNILLTQACHILCPSVCCKMRFLSGVRHMQTADLQTCRLADLPICRLADLQTCRLADSTYRPFLFHF